ncbi:MAG TPA: VCBS repeat-containing protein [Kofleriaceae bacterium]|nr:VCBS repeat-containing protein [Kofleriaceae bacterium]
MRLLALAAVVATGCYSPSVKSCQYECASVGQECPNGFSCEARSKLCVRGTDTCVADAAPAADAAIMGGCAPFGFTPTAGSPYAGVGVEARALAVGDLDGDGRDDLAVAAFEAISTPVVARFGAATGPFATTATYADPSTQAVAGLAVLPVSTGPTLVAAIASSTELQVLGVTSGALAVVGTSSLTAAADTGPITVADVTSDNVPDVVIAGTDGAISVAAGNGTGLAAGSEVAAPGGSIALGVGTFDPGAPGGIVAASSSGLFFYEPKTFTGHPYATTGVEPTALAVGNLDQNGDGLDDVVTIDATNHVIEVYRVAAGYAVTNTTTTAFTPNSATSAVLADFDRDGMLDLAVADPAQDEVLIYPGTGGGGFDTTRMLALGFDVASLPFQIVARDVDKDGRPDLEVLLSTAGKVAVLRNACGP